MSSCKGLSNEMQLLLENDSFVDGQNGGHVSDIYLKHII
jgi:hypothetical protein